jgi:Domain of unknown function (DUF4160)
LFYVRADVAERALPTIAYFLGIVVSMYYRDHNPPHIHVSYQGYEALIAKEDARVLRGKLPPAAMLVVRRWITLRRDALLDDWARARRHEPLERIAGPDDDDQGENG